MSQRHLSVIIKPTHNCNLSCKYCYLEEGAENGIMTEDILKKSIEKVSKFADSVHWIWHGGEPLLMGLDFFKKVKEIQKFYKKHQHKRFSNGIQTNGTLINNDFLDFINKEKDFYLGISIDGPKEINDLTRMYHDGSGSFDQIIKGIKSTKAKHLGGGAICVISSKNISDPKRLYDFFKREKINVKFNPLIKSGRANKNINELEINPTEYGDFLLKMLDIYNTDVLDEGKVTIDIDPFMEVIANIVTENPLGCNYSYSCRDNFISIGPLGDVYPCGRFDGIKEFYMGNIKINSIEEVLNSEINKKLKNKNLEDIPGCKTCNNKKICNSGCMHNAYCEGNVLGKDPYCKSYLKLFNKMSKVIKEEVMETP